MPLIVGGVSRNEQTRKVIQGLCQAAKALTHDHIFLNDEAKGFELFAGLEDLESQQEEITLLADAKTVFAGRIFTNSFDPTFKAYELPIESIKDSHGNILGRSYWGRYVLVSYEDRGVTIYRDPQGLATIFFAKVGDDYIFSSYGSLLWKFLGTTPGLNWQYLTSFVANENHNISSASPYEGVEEVLPGCETFLPFYGEKKIFSFWQPASFKPQLITDENEFSDRLYSTLQGCVTSWARGSEKVILELSGGLDSSSLLAVLKNSSPVNTEAFNLFHPDVSSSDEIEYVRDVAEHYNTPFHRIDLAQELPFSSSISIRHYDRPTSVLIDTKGDNQFFEKISIGKSDEIFSGQGGDHLFLAPPLLEAVVDSFLDRGIRETLPVIKDLSAYYRMPYLSLLKSTFLTYKNYKKKSLEYIPLALTSTAWMNTAFKSMAQEKIFRPHFWESLARIPPAKARQIIQIHAATLYIDRGYRIAGKPTINPLMSQPLVEIALSVPTYQSFKMGHNRYFFRKALEKHARGNFIWRKSKGETSGILILGIRKNFEKICSLLLDGNFEQQGLIDKKALYLSLNELKHGRLTDLWSIINLYSAERWINSIKNIK